MILFNYDFKVTYGCGSWAADVIFLKHVDSKPLNLKSEADSTFTLTRLGYFFLWKSLLNELHLFERCKEATAIKTVVKAERIQVAVYPQGKNEKKTCDKNSAYT